MCKHKKITSILYILQTHSKWLKCCAFGSDSMWLSFTDNLSNDNIFLKSILEYFPKLVYRFFSNVMIFCLISFIFKYNILCLKPLFTKRILFRCCIQTIFLCAICYFVIRVFSDIFVLYFCCFGSLDSSPFV